MNCSSRKCKRVRPLLGTFVEIELHGDASEEWLHAWITGGFEAIAEIDRLMSVHRPDSELSRINQSDPGDWVSVNPHTLKVLKVSNDLWRASRGAFDIRFGTAAIRNGGIPVRRQSGTAARGRLFKKIPFAAVLESRLTGMPPFRLAAVPVRLRRTSVSKTGPWTLDLGGIAKGYAVDRAVETIKGLSKGFRVTGIVNAGGDLRRWGTGAASVAVATSAVRTPENAERLSPAQHVQMPNGKILRKRKAVSVLSGRCLWSDALTKIMLLAPKPIAARCLNRYHAHGIVLA